MLSLKHIWYCLYLCFTEATAVMIHLGYRIKSLQLSFKEECFICVCMKVDFLPVWRDKNFYILVLNIYSYNITSLWYVVFVGDDKPSYSKLINTICVYFFLFVLLFCFCLYLGAIVLINCNMTFQYECIDIVLFLLIQYCMLWLKNMKDFCICFSCVFLCCETFIYFLEVMIALHQLLIFTHFCV